MSIIKTAFRGVAKRAHVDSLSPRSPRSPDSPDEGASPNLVARTGHQMEKIMNQDVNRRSIVAATTALASALASGVALPAETKSDPIFAAIQELMLASRRSCRAYDALCEALANARKAHGDEPETFIEWRGNYTNDIEKIRLDLLYRLPASAETIEREYEDAKARQRAAQAAARRWRQLTGVAAFWKADKACDRAYWAAVRKLARTAPTTPEGAGAMVQFLAKEIDMGEAEWHVVALKTAAVALRKMQSSLLATEPEAPGSSLSRLAVEYRRRHVEWEAARVFSRPPRVEIGENKHACSHDDIDDAAGKERRAFRRALVMAELEKADAPTLNEQLALLSDDDQELLRRIVRGFVSNLAIAQPVLADGWDEDIEARRLVRHAEFDRYQEEQDDPAYNAAKEVADDAYDAMADARDALFNHRPQSMAEYRERDAVLLELLRQPFEFGEPDLEAIFGGEPT